MSIGKKQDNKVNPPLPDCCDELLIDYIDSFGSNLANLRQDIRGIVREEVQEALHKLLQSRKSRPYVEVGYRGGGSYY